MGKNVLMRTLGACLLLTVSAQALTSEPNLGQVSRSTERVQVESQVRWRQVAIRFSGVGASDPELNAYLDRSPLHVGDLLRIEAYQTFKMSLLDWAKAQGYHDAVFDDLSLKINRSQGWADMEWVLGTGYPYEMGDIHFSKTVFSESFLRRFLPFSTGDRLTQHALNQLQERLEASGYFQSVQIETRPSSPSKTPVPGSHRRSVYLDVKPIPQKHYVFQLGYGSDLGPRAGLTGDWRYLGQQGHRLATSLKASRIQKEVELRYVIPGFDPSREKTLWLGRLFYEQTPSASMQGSHLSVTYQRSLENNGYSNYAMNVLRSKNKNFFINTTHTGLLYPEWHWRLHAGNTVQTVLEGRLLGSHQRFVSSLSFVQAHLKWQTRLPIAEKTHWVIRARGALNSTADLKLPVNLRLYVGGTDTLRGYPYQSIPSTGQPLARYVFTSSFEWHQRIHGAWFLVGYMDLGDAAYRWSWRRLKKNIGLGVARDSPLGGLHLSLAKPINDPIQRTPRIVLSFGADA